MNLKVLIIDDDDLLTRALSVHVRKLGHLCVTADTIDSGLMRARSESHDVVFLDVHLPDGDGLSALSLIRICPGEPEVIIITGKAHADGAELAIKNGAWDYVEKPLVMSNVTLAIERVLEYRREKRNRPAASVLHLTDIIGESASVKSCFERIARAAATDVNVLISGETGTGKEVFARAIHRNSNRAGNNMVTVDCASLAESLAESILFGFKKGAFTGAIDNDEGLILQANGGTLFLDEIGELSLNQQKKFLRVLEQKSYLPVGGKKEVVSDFRLIAATNRELEAMVKSGQFRDDLLFRLRALTIHIPPLRERKDDIHLLVNHYLDAICKRNRVLIKDYTPEFLNMLIEYEWPGNVRELIHTLERAILQAHPDQVLFHKHLPLPIRIRQTQKNLSEYGKQRDPPQCDQPDAGELKKFSEFKDVVTQEAEKQYLQRLITAAKRDPAKAMTISGLSRTRLYVYLKRHGLKL